MMPRKSAMLFTAALIPFLGHAFQIVQKPSSYASSINKSTTRTLLRAEASDSTARRSFLIASSAILVGSLTGSVPASAKFGDSTNIALPNYIDYLIEKNSGTDGSKILYKGADPAVLLRRLQDANNRLAQIPALAEQKKWTQITGVMTGPLGTLSQTLNQIATPDSLAEVQQAAKKLKSDLIAIGQGASKKNGSACTAQAQLASQDLESFVKVAFE